MLPEPASIFAMPCATASPEPTARAIQPLLLTREEAADLLSLSDRTIKRMTALKAIPGICRPFGRTVRYERHALEKWIAEGCPALKQRRRGGA